MPIFDFECKDCGHVFDELVKSADAIGTVACAKCASTRVERLVSVFTAAGARAAPASPEPRIAPRGGGCGPSCGCH